MSDHRRWFEEALAVADPVNRSEKMCDLAFDAEMMVRDGQTAEAIELFELLSTLDQYDDLLHPAIESAERHLILLGVRVLPSMEQIVAEVQQKYAVYQNVTDY